MKKLIMIMVVVLVAALAGTAVALDTSTLTVTASVVGTCKFSTAAATLAFGALDPSAPAAASAGTTMSYWCTKAVSPSFSHNDGTNELVAGEPRMAGPGGDFIKYALLLTADATAGGGPAAAKTLTISGTVAAVDYVDKSAGAYSDTVVITINP